MSDADHTDGVNDLVRENFNVLASCLGRDAQDQPCKCKRILVCSFCPWTRFEAFHDLGRKGEFTAWKNPLACMRPSDVARDSAGHVGAPRGWHQFWYAVHHLQHMLQSGQTGGAAGGGPLADPAVDPARVQELIEMLKSKAEHFRCNESDYERRGLLLPGGTGDEYGVGDKFRAARALLDYFGLWNVPRTYTRKRTRKVEDETLSQSSTTYNTSEGRRQ